MINKILDALRQRKDIQGWTLRHEIVKDEQLYTIPAGVESTRKVNSERFLVDVLRVSPGPDGELTSGSGNVTLLPGDDIPAALDQAALIASLVHNPPYNLPKPTSTPKVPLADPILQGDATETLNGLYNRLERAVKSHTGVRMTAAEFFATETCVHLWNSEGIDIEQIGTKLAIEWVLISKGVGGEMESFVEMTRRQSGDYNLEMEMERQAQSAVDSLKADKAQEYVGPVILSGRTLGVFLTSEVIQAMSSAASKYNQLTTWEVGKPVFKNNVEGDPLNAWANRLLPYGLESNCFDDEGIPAQRVALITDNVLTNLTASQRYAHYLKIPATGDFGNLEIAPGKAYASDLTNQRHIEIAEFSWFNPDALTGDFSCEIRLGYVVEGGRRKPFKGGQLVGNVMDALANVHWSHETGFFGNYQGPRLARFEGMKIAA